MLEDLSCLLLSKVDNDLCQWCIWPLLQNQSLQSLTQELYASKGTNSIENEDAAKISWGITGDVVGQPDNSQLYPCVSFHKVNL